MTSVCDKCGCKIHKDFHSLLLFFGMRLFLCEPCSKKVLKFIEERI